MRIVDLAQAQTSWSTILKPRVGTGATFTGVITGAIGIMLMIAGAMAVIYLIYSGILYITAAGNPDAAKKGQQGIINAVIGIVIIVLAYVILNAVVNLANTSSIT